MHGAHREAETVKNVWFPQPALPILALLTSIHYECTEFISREHGQGYKSLLVPTQSRPMRDCRVLIGIFNGLHLWPVGCKCYAEWHDKTLDVFIYLFAFRAWKCCLLTVLQTVLRRLVWSITFTIVQNTVLWFCFFNLLNKGVYSSIWI